MEEPPAIIYFGSTSIGLEVLTRLISGGIPITEIVTIDREMAMGYGVSGYASYQDFADEEHIPVHYVKKYRLSDTVDIDHFIDIKPDLAIGFAWNMLFPKEVLGIPKYGFLGAHAGHPPEGRGRAPIPWNIIKGYDDCYVYIFFMDERADSGEIINTRKHEITLLDDAMTQFDKYILSISEMYLETIPRILAGEHIEPVFQDHSKATFYEKRTPNDGYLEFSKNAKTIYDEVRAQSFPFPGTHFFLRDGEDIVRIVVTRSMPFDAHIRFKKEVPGTVLEVLHSGIVVSTGSIPIMLREFRLSTGEILSGPQLSKRFNIGKGINLNETTMVLTPDEEKEVAFSEVD